MYWRCRKDQWRGRRRWRKGLRKVRPSRLREGFKQPLQNGPVYSNFHKVLHRSEDFLDVLVRLLASVPLLFTLVAQLSQGNDELLSPRRQRAAVTDQRQQAAIDSPTSSPSIVIQVIAIDSRFDLRSPQHAHVHRGPQMHVCGRVFVQRTESLPSVHRRLSSPASWPRNARSPGSLIQFLFDKAPPDACYRTSFSSPLSVSHTRSKNQD